MEIITVEHGAGTIQILDGPEFEAVVLTVAIPVDEVEDCDSNEAKRDAIAEALADAARAALAG